MSNVQTIYRRQHAAYQVPIEELDVIVIDDSKSMQTIVRSMLIAMRVHRVRVFDTADEALQSMLTEPPHIILTDWKMKPTNGYQLLRSIRQRQMAPLCYVPLMFITAHGTRALVERALRSGAHHLLVKPLSPAALFDRLLWVTRDPRPMVLNGRITIKSKEWKKPWMGIARNGIPYRVHASTMKRQTVPRLNFRDSSIESSATTARMMTMSSTFGKPRNSSTSWAAPNPYRGKKGRPGGHRAGAGGFAEVIRRI